MTYKWSFNIWSPRFLQLHCCYTDMAKCHIYCLCNAGMALNHCISQMIDKQSYLYTNLKWLIASIVLHGQTFLCKVLSIRDGNWVLLHRHSSSLIHNSLLEKGKQVTEEDISSTCADRSGGIITHVQNMSADINYGPSLWEIYGYSNIVNNLLSNAIYSRAVRLKNYWRKCFDNLLKCILG